MEEVPVESFNASELAPETLKMRLFVSGRALLNGVSPLGVTTFSLF